MKLMKGFERLRQKLTPSAVSVEDYRVEPIEFEMDGTYYYTAHIKTLLQPNPEYRNAKAGIVFKHLPGSFPCSFEFDASMEFYDGSSHFFVKIEGYKVGGLTLSPQEVETLKRATGAKVDLFHGDYKLDGKYTKQRFNGVVTLYVPVR